MLIYWLIYRIKRFCTS